MPRWPSTRSLRASWETRTPSSKRGATTTPVHVTPFGVTYVSLYDDVLGLLRDPSLSVDDDNAAPTPLDVLWEEATGGELETPERLSMLQRDPPDHTRLRRLVSRVFRPRRIGELRPRIQELVDARLDALATEGGSDVIGGLALPLPFDVISEMLGMPDTDRDQVREWSGTVVRSLEPVVDPDVCGLVRPLRASVVEPRLRRWGDTADEVDLTRADVREHVAFGGGAHFCLGAALARLEAQLAIGTLVSRFATIEPRSDPEHNGRINLRGLERYELALRLGSWARRRPLLVRPARGKDVTSSPSGEGDRAEEQATRERRTPADGQGCADVGADLPRSDDPRHTTEDDPREDRPSGAQCHRDPGEGGSSMWASSHLVRGHGHCSPDGG